MTGAATTKKPGIGRLTAVELRKMVDTRAGFWLLLAVATAIFLIVLITGAAGGVDDRRWQNMLGGAMVPAASLLPVVGILVVSSEWTQRTALITFSLVPQRSRVLGAKALAAISLAVVAGAIAIGLGTLGSAVFGEGRGQWNADLAYVGQVLLWPIATCLVGVAFGMLFLNSPMAITLYYVVPAALAIVLGLAGVSDDTFFWFHPASLGALTDSLSMGGTEWGRIGTSMLVWIGLPAAIGAERIQRGEVR